jgi:NADPH2:quinone reductase
MRAVVVESLGGPEVLHVREVDRPSTSSGETLIQVDRAGINFSDISRRRNGWTNPTQPLPVIPGFEVVGRRVSDGARVLGVTTCGSGGYAEFAVMPESLTLPVPDGVSDTAALAAAVQGVTAWGALLSGARLVAGDTVAIMAAAGGVGSLAVQLARLHGASRVIAVASTDEKRRLALTLGADAAVDGDPRSLARSIRAANDGAGVDVLLESVGGSAADAGLDALAHNGRLVVFGQASGASNTVSLDLLMDRSIGVVGYWVTPFMRDGDGGRAAIGTILSWIADGRLRVPEGPSFPIEQASAAHSAIEARTTVGKVSLSVDEGSWDSLIPVAGLTGRATPATNPRRPYRRSPRKGPQPR